MRKRTMGRVYVGDVGEIPERQPKYSVPKELDTSQLTFRQLCGLALAVGIDVRDIIGVKTCKDHYDMVFLGDKVMPEGYNLFEHCVYCRNCWQFFRYRELPTP